MVVKSKESFEKTRHVKNNDKSKKFVLRGHRNTRHYEKILSKKRNLIIFYQHYQETIFIKSKNYARAKNVTLKTSEFVQITQIFTL